MLGATIACKAWPANAIEREVEIFPDEQIGVIRPELHGHFISYPAAFIDGGLWVGTDSAIANVDGFRETAVEQLRALGVPVLRWPGDSRRDFGRLCELTGAAPYSGGKTIEMNPATEDALLHYRKTGLAVETKDPSAVGAALSLNVLQRQADKVIAGLSPLDALLLMKGGEYVRSAIYYAFLLAKPHRGNISVKANPPQANEQELSISASRRDSSMVITVVNPRRDAHVRLRCLVSGHRVETASGMSVSEYSTGVPQGVDVRARPEGLLVELSAASVTAIKLVVETEL